MTISNDNTLNITTATATISSTDLYNNLTYSTSGLTTYYSCPPFYEAESSSSTVFTSTKKKTDEELSSIEKKIKERKKLNKKQFGFIDIKEYVPNKVYEFTIEGYKPIKTICDESDIFNLEKAFFIAYTKATRPELLPEGIIKYVENYLQYDKNIIKKVQNGIKLFKLLKEKEEYDKAEQERKTEQHKKYIQKKIERKKSKKNELYNVIRNAIEDAQ